MSRLLPKIAQYHRLQGHTEVQGIPVAIENRKGSVREGTTEDGHHWHTKMRAHYGYLVGTEGTDKEEVDAYVGPDKDAPDAYVVHQHRPDGTGYDEDKVILGVESKEEARKLFLEHYDSDKFLGPISRVPIDRLKELVESKRKLVKISAIIPESHVHREEKGNCGPASLRIALRQHGVDVPEKVLAKATGTTREGTAPEDIARVSGSKVIDRMPLGRLKRLTDSGTPVIAAYQDGPADSENNGHYSVVSQVDKDVHLSDPSSRKPVRKIPTEQFTRRWHDVDKDGRKRRQLGVVVKISEVIGHVAGPSGAGKTTLLRRMGEQHPGLITKDTDEIHDEIRAKYPEGLRPPEHVQEFKARLQSFLEANKDRPVLLGGGASKIAPDLGVGENQRWMMDTGPLASAWRRYRRPNEREWVGPIGERLGKITDIPRDYLQGRADIQKLRERGYQKKNADEIEREIGKALATSMRKEGAVVSNNYLVGRLLDAVRKARLTTDDRRMLIEAARRIDETSDPRTRLLARVRGA